MKPPLRLIPCAAGFLILLAACTPRTAPAPALSIRQEPVLTVPQADVRIGPPAGTLVVVGGGTIGDDIIRRFVDAAGGSDARIVVIPTAGDRDTFPSNWSGLRQFRAAGVRSLTLLHTRDPEIANTEEFIRPIREATGVWFPGGRQWRLADSYLGTRTVDELHRLLARGGAIGGTSAGASVQASYMVRGAREGNTIVMAPGYEVGFGFLRNTAVDQHLSARNRQRDLLQVVTKHPDLLGIGLDESTAIIVRGDTAEVIGRDRVAFYNMSPQDRGAFYWFEAGDRVDLRRRITLRGTPVRDH